MSGSGGGGYGGGFDGGASCEDLVIDTQLSSPRAAVVKELKVGDRLAVVVEQQGGVKVVVLKHRGQSAGGIASPELPRLLQCLEAGTEYSAKVMRIHGPQISLRITARTG